MNAMATHRLLTLAAAIVVVTPAHAEIIELEGTVKAVDAEARTISIERKTAKGTKILELEVNKKAGDLSAVKVGDKISFSYDPGLELVTKIASQAGSNSTAKPSSPKGGRAPGQSEEALCRETVQTLESKHYLKPRIDGDACSRMMDLFVRSLDPMKAYLQQADIDSFEKNKKTIAGRVRSGDLTAFYDLFNRFCERVAAQLPLTEELIKSPHDFNKQEFIETDRHALAWPSTNSESQDNWRRRIKYETLALKAQGITDKDAKETLLRRYQGFAERTERMPDDDVLALVLNSLVTSIDPYSTFMSGDTQRAFEYGRGQSAGIGAQLRTEDGYVSVVTVSPGEAAEKDGRLMPGDRVVGIGQGASGPIEDIANKSLEEVVRLERGEPGTTVRLQVLPGGNGPPRVYDLERFKIDIDVVVNLKVKAEVFSVDQRGTKALKVGVIRLPTLYVDYAAMNKGNKNYKSVVRECKSVLEGFALQKVDCVVLDVRGVGGGTMPTAAGLLGLLIESGRVGYFKTQEGEVRSFNVSDPQVVWDGPLVVWTNRFTATCAEIFAGAVQDHHRGVIVGDTRTFGKASGGEQVTLEDKERRGILKIDTTCFYRAAGEGVQYRGIRSDVVLPSLSDLLPTGRDGNEGASVLNRVDNAGFQPVRKENPSLASHLQDQSDGRVQASKEFQQVADEVEHRVQRQRRGRVSLVEADFMKTWQKEASRDYMPKPKTGGINRDFYLEEVLAIAADVTKASSE